MLLRKNWWFVVSPCLYGHTVAACLEFYQCHQMTPFGNSSQILFPRKVFFKCSISSKFISTTNSIIIRKLFFPNIKCKNIFTKMLKDVGMEVPKSIETCRQRQGMIACNNHNMRNPIFTDVGIWGYACYDCCMLSSPAFVCMHAEL